MKTIILCLCLFVSLSIFAQAQTKPSAPVKLITKLGNQPGGNTGADVIRRISDSAVNVIDPKGYRYPVEGFTIVYYFLNSFVDEETQQKKQAKDMRSLEFTSDKLSPDWSASIKENVQISDTLLITNVYVRMKDGKKRLAPPVKYVVMF